MGASLIKRSTLLGPYSKYLGPMVVLGGGLSLMGEVSLYRARDTMMRSPGVSLAVDQAKLELPEGALPSLPEGREERISCSSSDSAWKVSGSSWMRLSSS